MKNNKFSKWTALNAKQMSNLKGGGTSPKKPPKGKEGTSDGN